VSRIQLNNSESVHSHRTHLTFSLDAYIENDDVSVLKKCMIPKEKCTPLPF